METEHCIVLIVFYVLDFLWTQATIIDLADFRSPDGLDSTVTSATLYSHIESTTDLRYSK